MPSVDPTSVEPGAADGVEDVTPVAGDEGGFVAPGVVADGVVEGAPLVGDAVGGVLPAVVAEVVESASAGVVVLLPDCEQAPTTKRPRSDAVALSLREDGNGRPFEITGTLGLMSVHLAEPDSDRGGCSKPRSNLRREHVEHKRAREGSR